ncbi:lysosome-associated membrane glycoprotein 1-like isoform X2 [Carassius auratus]|uniref:Lysosome-associated membrane glycoprotein 2 n=1 Tax=Carassius auratus TaxID=7957 RepID=A0A6P6QS85_CARAU|nr:lysosome-associated membrane glycoprotein 1-like isoform X2 [Carassius auratus]
MCRRRRVWASHDLYERRFEAELTVLLNRVTLGPGVTYRLSAQRKHPPVAMAVRGCLTLLFILLSGIVHAEDLVTSSLPSTQEFSTSIVLSGTSPTTSKPSSTAGSTAVTTGPTTTPSATEPPTTPRSTTIKSTTEPPTTPRSTTIKSTTEPTTTPRSTTIKYTTEPTTTPHSTTIKYTTEPTTTPHSTTIKYTTEPTTTPHSTTIKYTTEPTTTPHSTTIKYTTEPTTTPHSTTIKSTTEPPTTPHHKTTNSTTEAPTTAHSATTAPTPPTSPPVPNPTVGNYSVKSDNVTVCLLAKMGLQFSFRVSENSSFQTLNFDPSANVTEVSGTCGSGGSDSSLLLKSEEITVHFVFTNVSLKFRLHALTLSVKLRTGNFFHASNNNLSLWEASVGSSYMCKKEQSYNITDKLTLNTFELQVQPFAVQNNKFNAAHECSMDDTSLLIPIIVGAALAGLIFIVVIAYVIGRRRTYAGYQTL